MVCFDVSNLFPSIPPSECISLIQNLFDITNLFDGTLEDLQEFFPFINGLHEFISFTMELESTNTLPFLDILLYRSNDHINFCIYHKCTNTDCLIPFNSYHPFNQKAAALNSFFHLIIITLIF